MLSTKTSIKIALLLDDRSMGVAHRCSPPARGLAAPEGPDARTQRVKVRVLYTQVGWLTTAGGGLEGPGPAREGLTASTRPGPARSRNAPDAAWPGLVREASGRRLAVRRWAWPRRLGRLGPSHLDRRGRSGGIRQRLVGGRPVRRDPVLRSGHQRRAGRFDSRVRPRS